MAKTDFTCCKIGLWVSLAYCQYLLSTSSYTILHYCQSSCSTWSALNRRRKFQPPLYLSLARRIYVYDYRYIYISSTSYIFNATTWLTSSFVSTRAADHNCTLTTHTTARHALVHALGRFPHYTVLSINTIKLSLPSLRFPLKQIHRCYLEGCVAGARFRRPAQQI